MQPGDSSSTGYPSPRPCPRLSIIAIIAINATIAIIPPTPIIPIVAHSPDKPFRSRQSSRTAPVMVRLHRWAGGWGWGWGWGWGLGLVNLSDHGEVYHTLRLRPWCRGRGRS